MKFYVISDNIDTNMGMRLAGMEGVVLHERDQVLEKLRELMQDPEIGAILITEKLMGQCFDVVQQYKLNYKRPLIAEIPDRHGSDHIASTLERYVSEAVGIKLD